MWCTVVGTVRSKCQWDVNTLPIGLYVMDTKAFGFVLGTDFFVKHPQILSLGLKAPYVLQVDHGDGWESVPQEQSEHTSSYLRVCKKEP